MPVTNNAQLFLKNFGNIDLFQFADPDALKSFVINDIAVMNSFNITNGGFKNKAIVNKKEGPDVSTIPLNMSNIKTQNVRLFNTLRAGSDLGPANFSKGTETQNYSSVDLNEGVTIKANPVEYSDVPLKFFV